MEGGASLALGGSYKGKKLHSQVGPSLAFGAICSPGHTLVLLELESLSGEPASQSAPCRGAQGGHAHLLILGSKFQYIGNIITETLKQELWGPRSPHSSLLIPSHNISALVAALVLKAQGFIKNGFIYPKRDETQTCQEPFRAHVVDTQA